MFKTSQDLVLTIVFFVMRKKYENEFLGQSKTELKKEWENCWDRILTLNPQKDYQELVDLNKRFDKCVEAFFAIDCGEHWDVTKASDVKRKKGTYVTVQVQKES